MKQNKNKKNMSNEQFEEKTDNLTDNNTENIEIEDNTNEESLDLENQVKELQTQLESLNDKYLRLFSEFDNYRKRTLKEKDELRKNASEDIIKDLLPVIDDMGRANEAADSATDIESVAEGVKIITNKLMSILAAKGLQPIEAIGQPFDTDFHEAITTIKAGEDQKGIVIDETQKGYMLNDKVIRFSKVIIGE